MFEQYTYEFILSSMLNRVDGIFDKREGGVIYTALAPAAAELAQMYVNLDIFARSKWLTTATNQDLDNFAFMFGLERKPSTPAQVRGLFYNTIWQPMSVAIGSRFSCNAIFYRVQTLISLGTYSLIAEVPGPTGNQTGTLLPDVFIAGLGSATINEILYYGEETENDDSLRERLITKVTNSGQNGNIAQYLLWAQSFPGIGRAKVFPTAAGYVTVSIINPAGQPAAQTLIDDFQNYLDPGSTGLGNGEAPIGATVTVITADPLNIDISLDLSGTTTEAEITDAINDYLASISFVRSSVSYFQIAAIISNLPGTNEISNLLINYDIADIQLDDNEVPILNSLGVNYI